MSEPTKMNECKISRRLMIQGVAVAGSLPLLAASMQPAAAKISQASVAYQSTPHGTASCSGCNLFQAPNQCKTVEGPVAPTGWCKIWVKKAS